MDVFDGPRKMPVEQSCYDENDLKEIEEQTCLLFEEFLKIDDPILDAPRPADLTYEDLAEKEKSDSPVLLKTQSRGFCVKELKESFDGDDVVSDSVLHAQSITITEIHTEPAVQKPEPKISLLAQQLQEAGDELVVKYGTEVQNVEGKLLQLVKQEAANLTYERFSQAVDDLVGRDKDWTSFVFAFCVGKRIVKHSQDLYSTTKNYFQQYIAQSYSQTLRDSGGVEPFLRTRGQSMTQ